MQLKDLGISKLTFAFVLLFIWSAFLFNKQWKSGGVIANDMNYYYIYLPATFIYHDITLNYVNDKLPAEVYKSSWRLPTEDNKHWFTKMSCGFAMMLMPFFLVAHLWVLITHGAANGYSETYSLFLCLATYFYLLIGLFYLYKTLMRYFNERTTALTIISISLGTNVFLYSTYSFSNPHIFCFCLISIFVWKTIQWHDTPTRKNWIILGLLLGLITLVRPNDIVVGIFPLLYGIFNKDSIIAKANMLKGNLINILWAILGFIICILPQLIIWKIQTGHFVYYSYQDEHFFFNHPHILQGLFSFRNGMFIYTPILLIILPGFIYAIKTKAPFALAIIVFFLFNSFIVFSWWCWWYGGSFGIRAMIDCYPILAIPFGAMIHRVLSKSRIWLYGLTILLFFGIILNQFQSLQYQSSLLHYSDMTYKAYKLIFGRLSLPENYEQSLNHPDIDMAMLGKEERDFSTSYPFLKDAKRINITLKAANGFYVSADPYLGRLVANRTAPKEWETFKFIMEDFGRCYLMTWQKKYACAKMDDSAKIYMNSDNRNVWERFYIDRVSDNKYTLKASNKKYLAPNVLNGNILEATSDSITKNELFEITPFKRND